MILPRFILAATLLAVAGCDSGDSELTSSDDAAAKGQVQGGTVSDAMVPLDQVQSQSPPLRPAPQATAGAKDDEEQGEAPSQGGAATPAPDEAAPADEAAEPAEEG